jgi:hypothetical protein
MAALVSSSPALKLSLSWLGEFELADLNAEATDAHPETEPVLVYVKVTGDVLGL